MDIDQAKIDLSGDMAAPAQPAATNVSRSGIVDELAELRERVDHAIEKLSTGQAARRRQSQGLMTRQTDLEAKYEARSEELDHCGRRIEALTRKNADLMGLVDRLVQTVDDTESDLIANWSSEDNDTPEADACDGRELVVGSEGPMETSAKEKKQTTEPNEAPVNELVSSINELVSSINDEPDRQQKTKFLRKIAHCINSGRQVIDGGWSITRLNPFAGHRAHA